MFHRIFRSHGVLRQQNSGSRQVARWFGSSGAPGQNHFLEGDENRTIGVAGTQYNQKIVFISPDISYLDIITLNTGHIDPYYIPITTKRKF